jgi:PIN domain nuclease of toxin-antitoxin system
MLWAVGEPKRLRAAIRAELAEPRNDVVVSAVSVWEAAIKRAQGRLGLVPEDLQAEFGRASFSSLAITNEHALAAGALPLHHKDPFDRMLVAQEQLEGLTIVTHDPRVAAYDVAVLPA